MRPFDHQRVLLGVTGGIASYTAAWLARLLAQAGAVVDVVLTRAASEFIGAFTFEALTGRPVHTALTASGRALDHIALARAAQLVVVAPATADFLARAVGGHADDLLSACLLATTAPTLLVPALNDRMWAQPAVRRNAAAGEIGYHVLDPDNGALAVGEGSGPDRMSEPETIPAHCARLLEVPTALRGRRLVVTAGPTREPIDSVRFLSNHSSGKMGVAIAAAAWRRGAEVTWIAAPLDVAVPAGVHAIQVETTAQMHGTVERALAGADALIMAAAPADFAAAALSSGKIKKAELGDALALTATDDILLSTRGSRSSSCVTVGFALETGDARSEVRRKLADKGLDFIVSNDAHEEVAGFASDTNRVTIMHAIDREEKLPLLSKTQVADEIFDRVGVRLYGR